MTDREKVNKIIRDGGSCSYFCCENCPLNFGGIPCGSNEESIVKGRQWLKDHTYTYADVDLPDWWDGRPIKGYAWDEDKGKRPVWCVGYDSMEDGGLKFQCRYIEDNNRGEWFEYFEPSIEQEISAKVIIEKDGIKREIELTAEQVEALGL